MKFMLLGLIALINFSTIAQESSDQHAPTTEDQQEAKALPLSTLNKESVAAELKLQTNRLEELRTLETHVDEIRNRLLYGKVASVNIEINVKSLETLQKMLPDLEKKLERLDITAREIDQKFWTKVDKLPLMSNPRNSGNLERLLQIRGDILSKIQRFKVLKADAESELRLKTSGDKEKLIEELQSIHSSLSLFRKILADRNDDILKLILSGVTKSASE